MKDSLTVKGLDLSKFKNTTDNLYCSNIGKKQFIKEVKKIFDEDIRIDQFIMKVFYQDNHFLIMIAYFDDEKNYFDVVIVKDYIKHKTNLLDLVSWYVSDNDIETKCEFVNDIVSQTVELGKSMKVFFNLDFMTDGIDDAHLQWALLERQEN